jgi:hypothetical protein
MLLIAAVALLLIVWSGWLRLRKKPDDRTVPEALIPAGISLQSQPLLTEAEASFYNLLRLAVQDQYLVLTQVPLWCLLDIKAQDRGARAAFLKKIAFRRVDFVLVHPGTLAVVKVIELDDEAQASRDRQERTQLIGCVLKMVGIELVRLKTPVSCTVPALAELLGCAG